MLLQALQLVMGTFGEEGHVTWEWGRTEVLVVKSFYGFFAKKEAQKSLELHEIIANFYTQKSLDSSLPFRIFVNGIPQADPNYR